MTTEQLQVLIVMLTIRELVRRVGISRSSVYSKINPSSPYYDPTFPRPVRVGSRSLFVESEVNAWLEGCIAASRSSVSACAVVRD